MYFIYLYSWTCRVQTEKPWTVLESDLNWLEVSKVLMVNFKYMKIVCMSVAVTATDFNLSTLIDCCTYRFLVFHHFFHLSLESSVHYWALAEES